jgi:hypothetical protein
VSGYNSAIGNQHTGRPIPQGIPSANAPNDHLGGYPAGLLAGGRLLLGDCTASFTANTSIRVPAFDFKSDILDIEGEGWLTNLMAEGWELCMGVYG